MSENIFNELQIREVFHLEFLRWMARKSKADTYALKGGVNLRCFFKSIRYSEDMDLDVLTVGVHTIQDTVMGILNARLFVNSLKPYGIEKIVPPDIGKAKQTETTQRFKVHLITYSGEDLFTQIECSHRGITGKICVQAVSDAVLREYKMSPLLVPHYEVSAAVSQKIHALALRSVIQARDVFDLYILSPQYSLDNKDAILAPEDKITRAYENLFLISFEQFRDTVIVYLADEDAQVYGAPAVWEEIKLKTAQFLDEIRK